MVMYRLLSPSRSPEILVHQHDDCETKFRRKTEYVPRWSRIIRDVTAFAGAETQLLTPQPAPHSLRSGTPLAHQPRPKAAGQGLILVHY